MDMIGVWMPLNTEYDISSLMKRVGSFHDSCVKEMHYISGAYVDKKLSMYPVNSIRQLSILVQRQEENWPVIELQFEGVVYLTLWPQNENYTSEILDATLMIHNEHIIWSDHLINPDTLLQSNNGEEGIVVCAASARWRVLDKRLGEGIIYADPTG